jgi:hypothetical protein
MTSKEPTNNKLADRDALILTYDVNSDDSFKALESLFQFLMEYFALVQ